jgi:hypothetical protein
MSGSPQGCFERQLQPLGVLVLLALLLPARIPPGYPAGLDRIPWGFLLAAVAQ